MSYLLVYLPRSSPISSHSCEFSDRVANSCWQSLKSTSSSCPSADSYFSFAHLIFFFFLTAKCFAMEWDSMFENSSTPAASSLTEVIISSWNHRWLHRRSVCHRNVVSGGDNKNQEEKKCNYTGSILATIVIKPKNCTPQSQQRDRIISKLRIAEKFCLFYQKLLRIFFLL